MTFYSPNLSMSFLSNSSPFVRFSFFLPIFPRSFPFQKWNIYSYLTLVCLYAMFNNKESQSLQPYDYDYVKKLTKDNGAAEHSSEVHDNDKKTPFLG